jgi:translocation and assembly module TamB
VTGRFNAAGVIGAFEGLSGQIAGVPLLIGEGRGDWAVQRGDLSMEGAIRIADAEDPVRFHPLVSEDFRLTLIDNRIRAGGWLLHPASGARVTEADVTHDLRTGAGTATLEVPGLRFMPGGLQPDDLTPLTVGVVALVDGVVTGLGRIEWDETATRSTGRFSTQGMNLAAPFGPVEGLTTAIDFTDLLGLVSAPGQIATVDLIQTGVDVFDGVIRYQLLPDNHVRIEGGRWPFSGGDLILEPTVLDFSQPSTHYLTFRVIGLDAARFVQRMEFGNIAATGTFDGVIPMQIDQGGGRIVGGSLIAREGGGTLSYIGELTDRDLGVYGKLAFDALKSLRYERFIILMDGALDGEFFTQIELDGIARDPELTTTPSGGLGGLVVGRALSQLARIPFEFNITIRGPFRALIATARSFDDPTPLLEQVLPEMLRDADTDVQDIQDEESEAVR